MTTALHEIARLRHAAFGTRSTQDDVPWPQDEAFVRADLCVREIVDTLKPGSHGAWWSEPHVSLTPEGEVSLSWTLGPRQLFVYVGGSRAVSVRVSGTSINDDMDFEDYPGSSAFPRLWRWLLHGDASGRSMTDELQRVAPTKSSKEARTPRPPEELVGALQDRVHRESGAMRAAKSVRVRNGR